MAGSILVTKTDLGGAVTKYSCAWTSDASGAVSANTFDIKRGRIYSVKFVSGSPTPTTAYAIKLLDPDSADLLMGLGASVTTPGANYASMTFDNLPFSEGFASVTPTVSAAGASTQGTLVVTVGP